MLNPRISMQAVIVSKCFPPSSSALKSSWPRARRRRRPCRTWCRSCAGRPRVPGDAQSRPPADLSEERVHLAFWVRSARSTTYTCIIDTLQSKAACDSSTSRYSASICWTASAERCEVDRVRQALRLRGLLPWPREDVYAAIIRCTAEPSRGDKQTRSKWSRVLRYVKMQKDEKEPLAGFVKRKGGINECNARYGRCLRRLAARRRSISEFQRRAASDRNALVRRVRTERLQFHGASECPVLPTKCPSGDFINDCIASVT
jgi:hypothetical protein